MGRGGLPISRTHTKQWRYAPPRRRRLIFGPRALSIKGRWESRTPAQSPENRPLRRIGAWLLYSSHFWHAGYYRPHRGRTPMAFSALKEVTSPGGGSERPNGFSPFSTSIRPPGKTKSRRLVSTWAALMSRCRKTQYALAQRTRGGANYDAAFPMTCARAALLLPLQVRSLRVPASKHRY